MVVEKVPAPCPTTTYPFSALHTQVSRALILPEEGACCPTVDSAPGWACLLPFSPFPSPLFPSHSEFSVDGTKERPPAAGPAPSLPSRGSQPLNLYDLLKVAQGTIIPEGSWVL
jgi:hypothetical protein